MRGLVLMAGSPRRMEEIVLRQLKQAGGKFPLKQIVSLEHKIFAKKFSGLYEMPDEEAKKKKFAGNLSLYYFKEMGQKTAADYLLETAKPALIMQGGKDFQVLADDDFQRFQTLLAGRENTVFKLYENLNHLFVTALYGDILKASKEYAAPRQIGTGVMMCKPIVGPKGEWMFPVSIWWATDRQRRDRRHCGVCERKLNAPNRK